MAVALDAAIESVRTGTSDPHTWTHTPVGTPRAILVTAVHGVNATDSIAAVTYGGVAMIRLRRAVDTATEPGAAEIWGLFENIPTGAQTVSVDLTSATTDDFQFVSMSFTASGPVGCIARDSIDENVANPAVTLAYGGQTCIAVGALYGGGAAPGGTIQAGCERVFGEDLGAFYADVIRQSTPGSSDTTIGFSTLTADDVAFVAVAIGETLPASNLTDNFNDNSIDTAKWSSGAVGTGSTMAEANQRIEQTPGSSVADAEGYLVSKDFIPKYYLTGEAFFVNLAQALSANVDTQTAFFVVFDDDNYYRFLIVDNPRVIIAQKIAGAVTTDITSASYSSTTHAWLRIRESAGTTYFDVSSDGSSWSNFASTANPFPVTSVYPKVNAYAPNVASPGAAWWDSFNVAPPGASQVKKVSGVVQASLKKVSNLAIASVKKIVGVTNT